MVAVKNHFQSDEYGKWRQVVGPYRGDIISDRPVPGRRPRRTKHSMKSHIDPKKLCANNFLVFKLWERDWYFIGFSSINGNDTKCTYNYPRQCEYDYDDDNMGTIPFYSKARFQSIHTIFIVSIFSATESASTIDSAWLMVYMIWTISNWPYKWPYNLLKMSKVWVRDGIALVGKVKHLKLYFYQFGWCRYGRWINSLQHHSFYLSLGISGSYSE